MKRLLNHRSAPGLVVAILAVVLALGGTALATSSGGRSADGRALGAKKKKAKPVTARQLHAYVRRYVRKHPGPRGRKGATGAIGLPGPRGLPGAPGRNGSGQVREILSHGQLFNAEKVRSDTASCPSGEVATGGGYAVGDRAPGSDSLTIDPAIQVEAQASMGDGWLVVAMNTGNHMGNNANALVEATVVCSPGVDVTPPAIAALAAEVRRGLAR